jgi:Aldo/keto reductases, related to diketogulonate reductase
VWTNGKQAGIRQMEDSMRKLRVKRLDLMQVHNLSDVQTQLATLRDWKAAGRIRYLGVTHYHAGAHTDLEKIIARGDMDTIQVNYSSPSRRPTGGSSAWPPTAAPPSSSTAHLPRGHVRAGEGSGRPGVGEGRRLRELGTIFSQVDTRPARRHLRHPRHA